MPSRDQFRPDKKAALDVRRALRRAIKVAGLEEHHVHMVLAPDHSAHVVMGGGNPEGWPHRLPAIAVQIPITPRGEIFPAQIFCKASDDDPMTSSLVGSLCVQNCFCNLKELPVVLKHLWVERQKLVARLKVGKKLPFYQGRFLWEEPHVF